MTRNILEKAAHDLASIPPLIHRSARRTFTGAAVLDTHISHQHFEVIILLEEHGTLQVAEIGKKMQVAKAQMTQVMDRLAELDLVIRETNPSDRRAINVSLSSHGRKILKHSKARFENAVRKSMSALSDDDLEALCASLRKVKEILLKLS